MQAVRSFADAPDAALVVVDNQTAREYFDAIRLGALGDLRIPAESIDEVLSGGDASLGVAIDSDLFPELAEVLAAGGDLVLPSIDIERQNQIAEPQQGFLALLPDG